MPRGTIIHVELLSAQFERSAAFYADVFGWKADEGQTGGHRGFQPESEGPGGSWVLKALAQASGPVPYVAVDDLEGCLAAVERGGGRILMRKQSLGSRGHGALFVDPDGNVMGCLVAGPSEGRARPPAESARARVPAAKPASAASAKAPRPSAKKKAKTPSKR